MIHIGTCPHCNKHHLALKVVQVVQKVKPHGNLHMECPNCNFPIAATFVFPQGLSSHDLINSSSSAESLGAKITQIWPEIPKPNIPESLPNAVERALLQAETNFHQSGHEEAAAVMYRKALEGALKQMAPEIKGTLASRIDQLAKNGKLTNDLADWARQVKNLGNDGAHEIDAIERSEVESLRGLTTMVLTYLFTLPEQVRVLRQGHAAPAP